jgi:hypothetical protein
MVRPTQTALLRKHKKDNNGKDRKKKKISNITTIFRSPIYSSCCH